MVKFLLLIISILFYNFSIYAITVEDTIKSTVEKNTTVKLGLEKINESKELIESSLGNFRPDINLTLTEKKSSTETITGTTTTNTTKLEDTYQLVIKQNLYKGGRNTLELQKSKIQFDNQVLIFYNDINNLIIQAIDGYLTFQVNKKSLDFNKKNLELLEKFYFDKKKEKSLGIATELDLKNAKASYEIAQSNLIISEGNLEIGKKTFKRVAGLNPINLKDIVNIYTLNNFDEILNNILKNNHELKILKNDYEIAKIQLDIHKKIKLPTLDLTGTISYNDDVAAEGTESNSGSLSAQLSIPIFQQGIENSDIRKYQSQLIQSQLKIDDKIDELKLTASILFNNYTINKSLLESSSSLIDANQTSLELVKIEYKNGIRKFNDVIEQEENLLDAQLDQFNYNKELLLAYFNILLLQGLLIEEFNEYLPKI
tara:strand:+ start:864 stop:2147 length:1284 start_codon:yes stop_codon:yes gene_type:complete